jgi:hypothetical protein
MRWRRPKGRPLLAGLAFVLLLGDAGWRASTPAEVRVSSPGGVSIQHEESHSAALPASSSGTLGGKMNASNQRLRLTRSRGDCRYPALMEWRSALAGALTTFREPPARARLFRPVTLRGPPLLQIV